MRHFGLFRGSRDWGRREHGRRSACLAYSWPSSIPAPQMGPPRIARSNPVWPNIKARQSGWKCIFNVLAFGATPGGVPAPRPSAGGLVPSPAWGVLWPPWTGQFRKKRLRSSLSLWQAGFWRERLCREGPLLPSQAS